MRILTNRDVIGGLILIGIGAAFFAGAQGLDFGTPRRMGPGFLPRIAAGLLAALGVAILATGLRRHEAVLRADLRPLLFIGLGILAFGVTVPALGLMPAVAAAVFAAAFASPGQNPVAIALLALATAAAAWAIFILGLGLSVPALRMPV